MAVASRSTRGPFRVRSALFASVALVLLAGSGPLAPTGGPGSPARAAPGPSVLTDGGALAAPPVDRDGWINETAVTREPSPALEAYTAATFDNTSGTAVAFGGLGAAGNVSSSTWVFDDGNWEDITPLVNGPAPPPLYDVGLAFDASDGYLLLFGGRTATGAPYGGTWSWDYQTDHWTNRTAPGGPPPESGGGLAYDPQGRVVVLDDPASNLTWTYHAGNWSARALTPFPGGRSGAVMVSDSSDGEIVLFGGERSVAGPALNDTWTYARGAWSDIPTVGGPPPLVNASGTDDPLLKGVFVVGSPAGGATETWSFSAGSWTQYQISSSNPPPRHDATMAYDTSGTVVLCGGTVPDGSRILNDCWAWGVAYIPSKAVANAPPIGTLVLGVAIALVAVPLAIALYLGQRPKRPSPTSVPTPSGTGQPSG